MALLTRHDRDSRAPGKPVALHVPSHVREHLVAGRGQAHRIGPLRAGHEPERHVTGQTQKLNEPGPGDLLDHGGYRRRQVVVGRLVPAHGEHVGCGRGVQGAPDDEAEIARTGRGDHRRLDRRDELVDDLARRGGAVRQPAPDRHPHGVQVDVREYRGLRGGLAVSRHVACGSGEQRAQIGHDPHPRPHHAVPPTSSATQCAQRRMLPVRYAAGHDRCIRPGQPPPLPPSRQGPGGLGCRSMLRFPAAVRAGRGHTRTWDDARWPARGIAQSGT